ncbi:hypothetical protein AURDEDRAFT_127329 [Auricularia subglabra TFB-10046 SS5]|nr:hypothetical protein AURDEDRAFT_127329 [Auricularia subglabra TFB-10046 SS5]
MRRELREEEHAAAQHLPINVKLGFWRTPLWLASSTCGSRLRSRRSKLDLKAAALACTSSSTSRLATSECNEVLLRLQPILRFSFTRSIPAFSFLSFPVAMPKDNKKPASGMRASLRKQGIAAPKIDLPTTSRTRNKSLGGKNLSQEDESEASDSGNQPPLRVRRNLIYGSYWLMAALTALDESSWKKKIDTPVSEPEHSPSPAAAPRKPCVKRKTAQLGQGGASDPERSNSDNEDEDVWQLPSWPMSVVTNPLAQHERDAEYQVHDDYDDECDGDDRERDGKHSRQQEDDISDCESANGRDDYRRNSLSPFGMGSFHETEDDDVIMDDEGEDHQQLRKPYASSPIEQPSSPVTRKRSASPIVLDDSDAEGGKRPPPKKTKTQAGPRVRTSTPPPPSSPLLGPRKIAGRPSREARVTPVHRKAARSEVKGVQDASSAPLKARGRKRKAAVNDGSEEEESRARRHTKAVQKELERRAVNAAEEELRARRQEMFKQVEGGSPPTPDFSQGPPDSLRPKDKYAKGVEARLKGSEGQAGQEDSEDAPPQARKKPRADNFQGDGKTTKDKPKMVARRYGALLGAYQKRYITLNATDTNRKTVWDHTKIFYPIARKSFAMNKSRESYILTLAMPLGSDVGGQTYAWASPRLMEDMPELLDEVVVQEYQRELAEKNRRLNRGGDASSQCGDALAEEAAPREEPAQSTKKLGTKACKSDPNDYEESRRQEKAVHKAESGKDCSRAMLHDDARRAPKAYHSNDLDRREDDDMTERESIRQKSKAQRTEAKDEHNAPTLQEPRSAQDVKSRGHPAEGSEERAEQRHERDEQRHGKDLDERRHGQATRLKSKARPAEVSEERAEQHRERDKEHHEQGQSHGKDVNEHDELDERHLERGGKVGQTPRQKSRARPAEGSTEQGKQRGDRDEQRGEQGRNRGTDVDRRDTRDNRRERNNERHDRRERRDREDERNDRREHRDREDERNDERHDRCERRDQEDERNDKRKKRKERDERDNRQDKHCDRDERNEPRLERESVRLDASRASAKGSAAHGKPRRVQEDDPENGIAAVALHHSSSSARRSKSGVAKNLSNEALLIYICSTVPQESLLRFLVHQRWKPLLQALQAQESCPALLGVLVCVLYIALLLRRGGQAAQERVPCWCRGHAVEGLANLVGRLAAQAEVGGAGDWWRDRQHWIEARASVPHEMQAQGCRLCSRCKSGSSGVGITTYATVEHKIPSTIMTNREDDEADKHSLLASDVDVTMVYGPGRCAVRYAPYRPSMRPVCAFLTPVQARETGPGRCAVRYASYGPSTHPVCASLTPVQARETGCCNPPLIMPEQSSSSPAAWVARTATRCSAAFTQRMKKLSTWRLGQGRPAKVWQSVGVIAQPQTTSTRETAVMPPVADCSSHVPRVRPATSMPLPDLSGSGPSPSMTSSYASASLPVDENTIASIMDRVYGGKPWSSADLTCYAEDAVCPEPDCEQPMPMPPPLDPKCPIVYPQCGPVVRKPGHGQYLLGRVDEMPFDQSQKSAMRDRALCAAVHPALLNEPVDGQILPRSEVPGQYRLEPGVPLVLRDTVNPDLYETQVGVLTPAVIQESPLFRPEPGEDGHFDVLSKHLLRLTYGDPTSDDPDMREPMWTYGYKKNMRDGGNGEEIESSISLAGTLSEGEGRGVFQPVQQTSEPGAEKRQLNLLSVLSIVAPVAFQFLSSLGEHTETRYLCTQSNAPRWGCRTNISSTSVQANISIIHPNEKHLSRSIGIQGAKHVDSKDCPWAWTLVVLTVKAPLDSDPGAFAFPEIGVYSASIQWMYEEDGMRLLGMRVVFVCYPSGAALDRTAAMAGAPPLSFGDPLEQAKMRRNFLEHGFPFFGTWSNFANWHARESAFRFYNYRVLGMHIGAFVHCSLTLRQLVESLSYEDDDGTIRTCSMDDVLDPVENKLEHDCLLALSVLHRWRAEFTLLGINREALKRYKRLQDPHLIKNAPPFNTESLEKCNEEIFIIGDIKIFNYVRQTSIFLFVILNNSTQDKSAYLVQTVPRPNEWRWICDWDDSTNKVECIRAYQLVLAASSGLAALHADLSLMDVDTAPLTAQPSGEPAPSDDIDEPVLERGLTVGRSRDLRDITTQDPSNSMDVDDASIDADQSRDRNSEQPTEDDEVSEERDSEDKRSEDTVGDVSSGSSSTDDYELRLLQPTDSEADPPSGKLQRDTKKRERDDGDDGVHQPKAKHPKRKNTALGSKSQLALRCTTILDSILWTSDQSDIVHGRSVFNPSSVRYTTMPQLSALLHDYRTTSQGRQNITAADIRPTAGLKLMIECARILPTLNQTFHTALTQMLWAQVEICQVYVHMKHWIEVDSRELGLVVFPPQLIHTSVPGGAITADRLGSSGIPWVDVLAKEILRFVLRIQQTQGSSRQSLDEQEAILIDLPDEHALLCSTENATGSVSEEHMLQVTDTRVSSTHKTLRTARVVLQWSQPVRMGSDWVLEASRAIFANTLFDLYVLPSMMAVLEAEDQLAEQELVQRQLPKKPTSSRKPRQRPTPKADFSPSCRAMILARGYILEVLESAAGSRAVWSSMDLRRAMWQRPHELFGCDRIIRVPGLLEKQPDELTTGRLHQSNVPDSLSAPRARQQSLLKACRSTGKVAAQTHASASGEAQATTPALKPGKGKRLPRSGVSQRKATKIPPRHWLPASEGSALPVELQTKVDNPMRPIEFLLCAALERFQDQGSGIEKIDRLFSGLCPDDGVPGRGAWRLTADQACAVPQFWAMLQMARVALTDTDSRQRPQSSSRGSGRERFHRI